MGENRNPWGLIIGAIIGAGVLVGTALVARQLASDYTKRYINKLVRERLAISLAIGIIQLIVLIISQLLVIVCPTPTVCIISKLVVWGIVLYNGYKFLFGTIPTIQRVRKDLRGMKGYVLTHILQISIVKELVEFNVIILVVTLCIVAMTRVFLSMGG